MNISIFLTQDKNTLFKRHPEQDSMTHLYIELSSHSSPFSPSTSSSSARTRRLQLSRARPTSRYFFIVGLTQLPSSSLKYSVQY